MDQVDPYVNLAPDRFAVLRDAWLQTRQQIDPSPNFTVVAVNDEDLPELERRTGKTEIQIYHELTFLALYLEVHHPLLCLRRAEQGWIQFWGEPSLDEVEWPLGGKLRPSEFVMATGNFLIREVKGAFLVLALLSIPCALFRLKAFTRTENLIFAVALWASVFTAFTEFGEIRRYCVPLYMLICYTVLTRIWLWITATLPMRTGATP
jgi:hypothetical protein